MAGLLALNSRRRGAAIIYITISMSVMMGFCSLGVDVARCQFAKSSLRHTARAAALAAAENLSSGRTAAINAAVAAAASNTCDGTAVALNSGTDIQFLNWVSSGNYTVLTNAQFSQANAVLVYARRTKATSTGISLTFGGVIGMPTCDVQASAIALRTQQSVTQYVPTTGNPWLAGEPTGTIGSVTDGGYQGPQVNSTHPWQHDIAGPTGGSAASGQAYNSPIQVAITVTPGSTITLTNVTGQGSNDPNLVMYNADGTSSAGISNTHDWAATGTTPTEHGMSTINAPHNAIIGVFLTNSLPDSSAYTTPTALDFTTQAQRDYTTLSPDLQQTFYAGDGLTSGNAQQQFVVPPNATRLFLGTMDGHEWANNVGGFNATITQTSYSIVQ